MSYSMNTDMILIYYFYRNQDEAILEPIYEGMT